MAFLQTNKVFGKAIYFYRWKFLSIMIIIFEDNSTG